MSIFAGLADRPIVGVNGSVDVVSGERFAGTERRKEKRASDICVLVVPPS